MFIARKGRNRRLRRHHVLDVKLSTQHRRRMRWHRLAVLAGSAVAAAAVVMIVWQGGQWLLRHGLYENRAFAIHQLDVETDGVLSREQIRSWAGVRLSDNLLALDLGRVKRDLELVPAIESVSVERVLPHTLRIRVVEREPVARALPHSASGAGATNSNYYTLDAAGYFMFPLETQQRALPAPTNEHLPVLEGIPLADIRPGRRTESAQVLAALGLITAFQRSPMAGVVDLLEIDVATPGVLRVRTAQSNEVVFGLGEPDPQLRRWHAVHDHARRTGRHVAWLDLSVSNNIPAHLVAGIAVTPPPRKPARNSPYRKKHV
ncbi:MAG TPA: FtsQ-type POTRA domain-containing protein [Methylomirabilota bacterium]|nr:FtsQ-type POTRA domain-containing protein [Methylomirabilota bacterium]